MLASAEEAPGRRNWSKCKVVADVTSTVAHLFPDGCVTQVALRKLIELGEHAVFPAIASRIHDLLKLQIRGTPVQAEIDAQLTLSLLPLSMQERVWSRIRMRPEHLLSTDRVMDIGHIVRDIMLLKTRTDVLFKLYQYTMPFIKHNRLNFPPMTCMPRVVLMHLMQLMGLSCLGLYSQHHKTPTLHIRKQLFRFFTNLLTLGSLRDIYSFCHHHMYLLRLALMEHFVYFTSTCMAKEMPMLLKCVCPARSTTMLLALFGEKVSFLIACFNGTFSSFTTPRTSRPKDLRVRVGETETHCRYVCVISSLPDSQDFAAVPVFFLKYKNLLKLKRIHYVKTNVCWIL
jgi:hypothetical protein